MLNHFKFFFCTLIICFAAANANAQKPCCSADSKAAVECNKKVDNLACCTKSAKETTAGCTPSNCRGAKTKFGEAKVISNLREKLVALKAKLEDYPSHKFSNQAITVHEIIGETDDESIKIVSNHLAIIESEVYGFRNQKLPEIKPVENKAKQVQQLQERINTLNSVL